MLKNIAEKIWQNSPHYFRHVVTRATQNKFTVSAAAIVRNEKNEVLVLDHFFRIRYQWGFPGGFIESHEQPEEAVKREIFEETSLKITDLQFVRIRTLGKHIEILFSAKTEGEVKINSGEIRGFGWFRLDNLPEMHPSEIEIIQHTMLL